jgi:FixJ family two-component response regulator
MTQSNSYYQAYLNRDRLIHIVDTDAGTCEALSVLFRLEGFQTAFSMNVPAFLEAIGRGFPDVAILNLHIGDEDGVAVLRRLKAMHTATPIFMLADKPDLDAAVEAMKSGANDVIGKPINSDRLTGTVQKALRADVHLGAMRNGRRPVEIRGFKQLTPREREVLELISNGQSNKEAGRELGISPRTIEVHRARVMEKLGARNTADLMRIVLTG